MILKITTILAVPFRVYIFESTDALKKCIRIVSKEKLGKKFFGLEVLNTAQNLPVFLLTIVSNKNIQGVKNVMNSYINIKITIYHEHSNYMLHPRPQMLKISYNSSWNYIGVFHTTLICDSQKYFAITVSCVVNLKLVFTD